MRKAQEERTKYDQQAAKEKAETSRARKRQKTATQVASEEGKKAKAEENRKKDEPQTTSVKTSRRRKSKERYSQKLTKKTKVSARLETLASTASNMQSRVDSAIQADYPSALLVQGIITSAGPYWNGIYEKRGIISGKPTWYHNVRHNGKTLCISKPAETDNWCISYKDYTLTIAKGSRTSYLPQSKVGNEWKSENGDVVTVTVLDVNDPAMVRE